jgi:iron-sulfur cluster insertion protein
MNTDTNKKPVELTESALLKIKDLLAEENNPALKLRMFIQGGGCSGFQYGFTFDEVSSDDDFELDFSDGVKMLVDNMSMQYVTGAVVDYKESLMESSFQVINPNASTTCGCGSSFSV